MKNYKAEIEKIVDGIGSPYGEGATYSGKSDAGKEACHLDEDERELMIKDIESLIREIVKEAIEKQTSLLMEEYNDALKNKNDEIANENAYAIANIKAVLSNVEELLK